jgi:chromosome segregation ATPase
MKSILLCCKQITKESETKEEDPNVNIEDREALMEVKQKLSESLTQVMQAAKEHTSGNNPKTAERIEQDLSTLSFCVSDLIELIKIVQSNASTLPRSNKRDTMRSAFESNPTNEPLPPLPLNELRDYLEEQIDNIAHAIQDLLQVMKQSSTTANELSTLVNEISQYVDNIIYETQGTIDTAPGISNETLNDCDDVLDILSNIRNELLDLGDDIVVQPGDRQLKQKVANSSYEIAKVLFFNDSMPRIYYPFLIQYNQ